MIPPNKKNIIYKGKIYNQETIELNTKDYKYLLISFVCFDYTDTNTGGGSNVVMLDLTTKPDDMSNYSCGKVVPYNIFDNVMSTLDLMGIGIVVNEEKTTLKVIFTYKDNFVVNNAKQQYYVSKIVGIQ